MNGKPLHSRFDDAWLVDGVRTPFVDYNGALATTSPIDLGIKVARAVFERAGIPPGDVGTAIAGSMAQASFDAYMLPRHIGLYAGVPTEVPAHLVQRVCGTGIEVLMQAADTVSLGRADLALCVGAESMSRNPVAAYTHRRGFRDGAGGVQGFPVGGAARSRRQRHAWATPPRTWRGNTRSPGRTWTATLRAVSTARSPRNESGFLAGEIVAGDVRDLCGRRSQGPRHQADGKSGDAADRYPCQAFAVRGARQDPAGLRRRADRRQFLGHRRWRGGGAGRLVRLCQADGKKPLARLVAGVAVGAPPHIMGIGPVPAIRALLAQTGLTLSDIDRFEINEAFGAQVMACARELGLDEDKLNVNGGAIAIGHPLGATGVRLALTLARELKRCNGRYGIASACIGGGQGIALLIENDGAAPAKAKHG